MARKRKIGRGRLLSWFGTGQQAYVAAKRAAKERARHGIDHQVVAVTVGSRIKYYVGNKEHVAILRRKYKIKRVA